MGVVGNEILESESSKRKRYKDSSYNRLSLIIFGPGRVGLRWVEETETVAHVLSRRGHQFPNRT